MAALRQHPQDSAGAEQQSSGTEASSASAVPVAQYKSQVSGEETGGAAGRSIGNKASLLLVQM